MCISFSLSLSSRKSSFRFLNCYIFLIWLFFLIDTLFKLSLFGVHDPPKIYTIILPRFLRSKINENVTLCGTDFSLSLYSSHESLFFSLYLSISLLSYILVPRSYVPFKTEQSKYIVFLFFFFTKSTLFSPFFIILH